MAIATTLEHYLQRHDVGYEVLSHPHSATSSETAEAAHVPGQRLAKSVLLGDENGYVMAVIPATSRLDLSELHRQLNRQLGLVTERELEGLFEDCELGAIPALGQAYGIETVIEDDLAEQPEIFIEAGDHEHLVQVSGESFERLIDGARHSHFSRHA